jgi:hypothetical protein
MRVVFCTPTTKKPFKPYLEAMEASVPLLDAEGIEHQIVFEVGCPYISGARATMTRKALDQNPDCIIYIDHDVSWDPQDLLALIRAEGNVVAGTYRIKHEDVSRIDYMGVLHIPPDGRQYIRKDGALKAKLVPAGFLKVTKEAIATFMYCYPELTYGPLYSQSVDLFNHGAVMGDRIWWGEDYAFCHRWEAKCAAVAGDIWLLPNMNIHHHGADGTIYPGNYHEFLLRAPGGSKSDNPNMEYAHGA